MAEIEDQGLLLRRIAYGESSLICHFLTAEHGRIAVMARGARRPKSAFRATLEPLFDLKLSWRPGRSGMGTLTDLRRAAPLLPSMQTLDGLELLALASRLFQEGDPHGFEETRAALAVLAVRGGDQGLDAAIWNLLDRAGLVGDMNHCWQCGSQVLGQMLWQNGALHCERCGQGAPVNAGLRRSISDIADGGRVRINAAEAARWRGMIVSLLKAHGIKAPQNL